MPSVLSLIQQDVQKYTDAIGGIIGLLLLAATFGFANRPLH